MNPGNELSWGGSSPTAKESAKPTKPGLAPKKRRAMSLKQIHLSLWNQPPQQPARGGWF
jgi:hypothetical protein